MDGISPAAPPLLYREVGPKREGGRATSLPREVPGMGRLLLASRHLALQSARMKHCPAAHRIK